jgi:predicted Zn-dependent peptidase
VTAADVQRVMKKYFSDNNRMVLYYLPESSKKGGQ